MDEHNPLLFKYCERAGDASLWAEPINTLTNLAFLIAAFLAFRVFRKSGIAAKQGWDLIFLIVTLTCIGIGSALYHMYATYPTLLMDVIPITVFINVYLLTFVVRILKHKLSIALVVWLIFQAVNVAFSQYVPADALNGSVMYAPAYLMLLVFLSVMAITHHREVWAMAQVVGVFTFSLTMRTFDHQFCEATGFGLHFGWHVLNGILLYLLLAMAIRAAKKA